MLRNPSDGRCLKTRQAVEEALYDFYSTHSYFERLTVRGLCREAKVSASAFYRNYRGIYDVVRAKDNKIRTELLETVGEESSLLVGLVRLFNFVRKNDSYFHINFLQERGVPFEIVLKIFESKILRFIRTERRMRRPEKVDQRICDETKNYLIFRLTWWIEKDRFDDEQSTERINEIMAYAKERILEMEKRLS
ncbi:hypothetical protein IKG48_01555 [Candidatus Saccharibacteria bacterium]|nr:hypothetical protein [Candidatus Saccharibacteria bacterium]